MALDSLCALGSTYEGINGGVHRRTASIVGIPSLIRHLGLWDVSTDPDAERRPKAFTKYLADLRAILEGGADGTISVRDNDKDLPSPMPASTVRSGTIRIARFCWHGIHATIRLEFRTEYVMITSILDLSVKPCAEYEVSGDPEDPQRKVKAALDRLSALFNAATAEPPNPGKANKRPRPARDPAEPPPATQQEYFAMARFLQYDLWTAFETSVLDAERSGQTILGANFGQVFADFRGIVTGSTAAWEPVGEPDSTKRRLVQVLRPHFELEPHTERIRKLEHGSPPQGWARDTLRRLWPLIEPDPYLQEYEFTVSGFLAGRALFVTALGPKLPDTIDCGWEWTPVCNFIHSYTDDVWQLGRLVDRIKYLGTLRLAATIEIEHLIDAGARVDELTAAMQLADQAIQREINRKTGPPQAGKAVGEAKGADRKSNRAGRQFRGPDIAMNAVRNKRKNIDKLVSNDIVYRLARSEYYIDQFTKGAAALRVKRIEGFQKYDEMVARRMSSVFSYIRLMKNRLTDVDARMSALSRAYTALKAVETTKDIQGLVVSTNDLVTSMTSQNRQIEQIQEFGEIALIGFLIPYYLGATLFYYTFHLEGDPAKIPWLVIITVFAFIVAARSAYKSLKAGSLYNTHGLTLLISVLYGLFIWLMLPALIPEPVKSVPKAEIRQEADEKSGNDVAARPPAKRGAVPTAAVQP